MSDTSLRVDSAVRDRLAEIADDQGLSVKKLLANFAENTLTRAERQARTEAASAYTAQHLVPGFGPEDLAAGERLWENLAAGHLALDDTARPGAAAA
ncbi:hypothetical protein [Longispora albida]|uniref:hypothetical protein n=1 Tax=Longispora albida TaxID=203523 RepID=UPI0003625276|nr:hypothetical protein [Longispora albida]